MHRLRPVVVQDDRERHALADSEVANMCAGHECIDAFPESAQELLAKDGTVAVRAVEGDQSTIEAHVRDAQHGDCTVALFELRRALR